MDWVWLLFISIVTTVHSSLWNFIRMVWRLGQQDGQLLLLIVRAISESSKLSPDPCQCLYVCMYYWMP